MRRKLCLVLLSVGSLTLGTGCLGAWRPSLESVREVPSVAPIDLAEYLPAVPFCRSYLRSDLRRTDESASPYERQADTMQRRDGLFADLDLGDLTQYLYQPESEEPARYLTWPAPEASRWLGLFMEFDPPLIYLPATIDAETEVRCRSDVCVFDRWGHRMRTGTVERTVRVEGFEDVLATDVSYRACLRLAIDTQIRVPWSARVDLTEYLWLAPGIGEVKRVERIQVLAVPFFYFDEAYVSELAAEPESVAETVRDHPTPEPAWARLAILLDRFLPRLRVGGVLVEYAPPAQ